MRRSSRLSSSSWHYSISRNGQNRKRDRLHFPYPSAYLQLIIRVGNHYRPSRWFVAERQQLHFLIRYKLGTKIQKLLKSTTHGNEGVVVKRWNKENHRYYNMKEMERQKKKVLTRYTQDNDLLLDVLNSDLLPYSH